jgi:hypothetical protein
MKMEITSPLEVTGATVVKTAMKISRKYKRRNWQLMKVTIYFKKEFKGSNRGKGSKF